MRERVAQLMRVNVTKPSLPATPLDHLVNARIPELTFVAYPQPR